MKPLFLLYQAVFKDLDHRRRFIGGVEHEPIAETVIIHGHNEEDRLKAIKFLEQHPRDFFKASPSEAWSRGEDLLGFFRMNALMEAGMRNCR